MLLRARCGALPIVVRRTPRWTVWFSVSSARSSPATVLLQVSVVQAQIDVAPTDS